MSEQDTMAQNTQEVSTAEVTPTPQNDTQVKEPQTQEATPNESTETQDPEIEVEEKRSRLEKRLNQLLEQNKGYRKQLTAENTDKLSGESKQIAQDVLNDPSQLNDIVNEYGEVDVVKLMGKVDEIANKRVQEVLRARDSESVQKRQVHDWYEDAENTLRQIHQDFADDPDLIESINQRMGSLVERMNVNNGQFSPKIKSSELYNELKETIVKARTKGQATASANLAQIADTGALKPKVNSTQPTDIDSLRQRMVKDPASVRKELEKRLPRAQD